PLALGLDKRALALLADDVAVACFDEAETAAQALGADVVWTLRQLCGLGRKPAARAPFEPAPAEILSLWAALGAGAETSGAEPSGAPSDLFPLILSTALMRAASERRIGANRITDGFVAALKGAAVTKVIGDQSVSFTRGTLKEHLFSGRRGEARAGDPELDEHAVGARLDRLLLFMAHLALSASAEAAGVEIEFMLSPARLDPGDAALKALSPSEAAADAFAAHLASQTPEAAARAAAFGALMETRGFVRVPGLAQLWRRAP
ncbi:MAG: hypothetical protein AAGM38_08385, partial [Pseudomonadota bacterium]